MKKNVKSVVAAAGIVLGSLYVLGCSPTISEAEQEQDIESAVQEGPQRTIGFNSKGTTHTLVDGTCSYHHDKHNKNHDSINKNSDSHSKRTNR